MSHRSAWVDSARRRQTFKYVITFEYHHEDRCAVARRAGLREYQAKIHAALVSVGPTGVTEVSRLSGVPRNKVYEAMDALKERGMVELQPGRPLILRAVPPQVVVSRLNRGLRPCR